MFIGPSLFHYRLIIGGMEGAFWGGGGGGKQRQQTSNPLTPEQEKSHKPNPDQLRDTISCRKNTNKWFFLRLSIEKKLSVQPRWLVNQLKNFDLPHTKPPVF